MAHPAKSRLGRPLKYGAPLMIRLTPEQKAALGQLAALWGVTEAEAVRRIIREGAKRNALPEGDGRSAEVTNPPV